MPKSNTKSKNHSKPKRDIAKEITDRMITAIKAGTPPWNKPWNGGAAILPLRHTGERYTGSNVLALWDEMDIRSYENPKWMTFRQAQQLGGAVRKGEKSTGIVYYGTSKKTIEIDGGEDDDGEAVETARRFLKHYNVFNVDQIDGLADEFYQFAGSEVCRTPPASALSAFFESIGADISHGGDRAFYRPYGDYIQMPRYGAFDDPYGYFSTLAHEHIHLTGAKSRLDRFPVKRDQEATAYEELIAEIGAAMLGSVLGLPPDHIEDHSAYVASWLKALRGDTRYILKAAAAAQRACDWLMDAAREGGFNASILKPVDDAAAAAVAA